MTTLRFRLPLTPGQPATLELDTHRGTANGREITLDAGGRLTLQLADGSTLTADLIRRPTIEGVPVGGHRKIGPRPTLEIVDEALKLDPPPADTPA